MYTWCTFNKFATGAENNHAVKEQWLALVWAWYYSNLIRAHIFLEDNKIPKSLMHPPITWVSGVELFYTRAQTQPTEGLLSHKTKSPWPLHFKHSHWWKRRSWSKFDSHYAWGTNGVCECNMDVKSTWIPTWHRMDHVSWSLGLFSKTTSWR